MTPPALHDLATKLGLAHLETFVDPMADDDRYAILWRSNEKPAGRITFARGRGEVLLTLAESTDTGAGDSAVAVCDLHRTTSEDPVAGLVWHDPAQIAPCCALGILSSAYRHPLLWPHPAESRKRPGRPELQQPPPSPSASDSHDEQANRPQSLMSAREVSERLGVHRNTVGRLVRAGAIPTHRVGNSLRFRPDDIERYIAESQIPHTPPR